MNQGLPFKRGDRVIVRQNHGQLGYDGPASVMETSSTHITVLPDGTNNLLVAWPNEVTPYICQHQRTFKLLAGELPIAEGMYTTTGHVIVYWYMSPERGETLELIGARSDFLFRIKQSGLRFVEQVPA